MSEKFNYSVKRWGEIVRGHATHHNHGEGWTYSRNLHGMKHIRYASDWTRKHNTPLGRIWWTALGLRDLFHDRSGLQPLFSRRGWMGFYSIIATIKVRMRTDRNLPDGTLNNGIVITFWEEDGEYIQLVGPTVGEKIADFLEAEPDNPYAIAIATEMRRIWNISYPDQEEALV